MSKAVKVIFIVLMAAAVVSGVILTGCQKADVKETFKIGFIGPLTGDIGFLGVGMKNAMMIARDELGDTRFNYEYLFEDTQNDPKLVATAAQKLMSVDNVDAVLTLGVNAGLVTSPIATKYNKIHFSIAIEPWVAKGDNNFIHWTPSPKLNGLLIDEMQRRGIRTVGVFRTVTAEGYVVYMDDLRKGLKNAGIRLVTDQTFQNGTKDFRSLISRAKPANPDIYVIFADTPELELLGKQIKEAGIKTPLTSIESFEVSQNMELFEGYWFVSVAEPSEAFARTYKERYGVRPPLCAPNAYDMVNLIVTAVERAGTSGKPTTAEISRELRKIKNFPGALGNLTINQDGIVLSEGTLKIIKNGEVQILKQ
ncbi:MAG: ABC transporter substrate-binding protein [Deferribacteres bacterium]|nr:ABC transporter substrate-binding protein [Deferribacteres bacterium]